ncbi:MAG: Dam family site-specific DNA-(adenine-N6)-methyltransferase [Candidatus Thermoplasmatota archaeon]|nr:Dam family site-specific DNA-(adenine-N6)-methyltransferase [Candidatus Thermoplasmatota archaeon]
MPGGTTGLLQTSVPAMSSRRGRTTRRNPHDVPKCTPFVKWAGGKTQLIRRLECCFPKSFNRYFEPFLGGGSVFFHLAYLKPSLKATVSDLNADLINAYEVIRDDPGKLTEQLAGLQSDFRAVQDNRSDKKLFYTSIRSRPPGLESSPVERAAWFIFLNKTSFNGLYRVNSKGEFNVPYGDYPNVTLFHEKNLMNIHALLNREGIELLRCDYTEVLLQNAGRHDFVYLDPPYYSDGNRGFTGYNASLFTGDDQARLAEIVSTLTERGCKVVVSNADSAFVKRLFDRTRPAGHNYYYEKLKALRAINCNGSARTGAPELLIRNF